MPRQKIPKDLTMMWAKQERLYIDVFIKSLNRLEAKTFIKSDEAKISLFLCPILSEVCSEESIKKGITIPAPDWEKPIQPTNVDELNKCEYGKRPDFTCKIVNPFVSNRDAREICLHIECKRLGEAPSKSWNLNKNYVKKGVVRFDSIEHNYGKSAVSGIMIGYIESMLPDQILKEVNFYIKKYYGNGCPIMYKCTHGKVQKLYQQLKRKNILPMPFKLTHLWIDLKV